MKTIFTRKLFSISFFLLLFTTTAIMAQVRPSKADLARQLLQSQAAKGNSANADLGNMRVSSETYSKKSGLTHVYFQQYIGEIPVKEAILDAHITKDDELLNYNSRFVAGASSTAQRNKQELTPEQALRAALRALGQNHKVDLLQKEEGKDAVQTTIFDKGTIASEDMVVQLIYQPMESGDVRLAWQVDIEQRNEDSHWWVFIDAATGEVLDMDNLVLTCNFGDPSLHNDGYEGHAEHHFFPGEKNMNPPPPAMAGSYNVFAMPIESPNFGSRSIVSNPEDLTASPFGWHDTDGTAGAEYTITRGNNVHAYDSGNNNGFSPDGGGTLTFDFPFNPVYTAADQSESASITNLFYWGNIIHDVTYQYGFDEVGGNFQANNYGRGGLANDHINMESQDHSECNARYFPSVDGTSPRLEMYYNNCGSGGPIHDGSFDNGVVAHEYGHGVSTRLVGGPSAICLGNAEQMGEGWSDWLGLVLTMKAGDMGTSARGIGTWLLVQAPNGSGVRTYPYSTNLAVNPDTYDAIKTSGGSEHRVGSIWSAMLWDVTWALTDKYGFDADFYNGSGGNNIAMHIIIEGMKMTPCSPGFIDGRDAILAADQVLYGGANQCLIWEAFAKRGLGYSASQGSASNISDGTQAFDIPPTCELFASPADTSICKPAIVSFAVSVGDIFTGNVTLSVSGQPGGTTATFTTNPVAAPGNTILNITNTAAAAPGSYTLTFSGTDGSITRTFDAVLLIQGGVPNAPTLVSPTNMAIAVSPNPAFTWNAVSTAESYEIQIATDNGFSNMVETAANLSNATYQSTGLNIQTFYYWRVRGKNACGNGAFSTVFSFKTGTIVCEEYESTDVPLSIPTIGMVSSTLNIPFSNSVADINVKNLNISHGFIDDLNIDLTSPQGTVVRLMERPCGSQDNILINLDDEAATSTFPCPPTNNGTYIPFQTLSAFDGQNPMGIWTMKVSDVASGIGGTLNHWNLDVCFVEDCDGAITCYRDVDNDGFGDLSKPQIFCSTCAVGFVANSTDCNDNDFDIKPTATEVCDFIDNNCDANIDEGLVHVTCYIDNDGDNYGNPATAQVFCTTCPMGYVLDNTDCNDINAQINPGAIYQPVNVMGYEICEGSSVPMGQGLTADDGNTGMNVSYSNTTPLPITDNNTAGVNSTINVPQSTVIGGLTLDLTITHTWVGDLKVKLTAPDGTTFEQVFDRPGDPASSSGCRENNIQATFDDAAVLTYADFENTCTASPPAPYAIQGTFKPMGSLSNFSGLDAMGNWTLNVSDHASQDVGTLESWTLNLLTLSTDINWYDAQTGGNQVGTGEVFDPTTLPVANGGVDPNIPGTTSYWAEIVFFPACGTNMRVQADFTVNAQIDYYPDLDNDGYGDQNAIPVPVCGAPPPANHVTNNTDCNDSDPNEFPGQTWYIDADGDDYGGSSTTACARPANGFLLAELSGSGTDDCDDNDPNEFPGQTWYIDADGDDYGGSSTTACLRPANGFLLTELSGNGTDDCDDNDPNEFPGQTWYIDADGDDYGGSSTVACLRPNNGFLLTELSGNGTDDCDDNDPNEFPGQTWYIDADGDDYGGSSTVACLRPNNGFLLAELSGNGTDDCNDGNPNEFPGQTWYIDADGDFYGGSSIVACLRPVNGYLLTSLNGTGTDDCDDNDPNEFPGQTWYIDADGDDYGVSSTVACLRPNNGYILSELSGNGTDDCDDNDPNEFPGQTWYIDADGDDYGGSSTVACLRPNNGFVLSELSGNGTDDCNDGNPNEFPGQIWYIDADGDSYGGSSVVSCLRPINGHLLPELSGNGTDDCDDSDPNEFPGQTWYIDADADAYGGSTTTSCQRPNNGYLLPELSGTGTDDCDDNDPLEHPGQIWFKDADGDDYSDGTSQYSCLRPTNYYVISELIAISGDCADNNPAVNPAATETCNGIDDDCDNLIDTADPSLVDNTPPSVVCKNHTVELSGSGQASIVAMDVFQSGMDNCGSVNLQSVSPSNFTCNNLGQNTVTLIVNDGQGNTAQCTATVMVQDNISPNAICQNITVQLNAAGNASITPAQVNNGTSDNCSYVLTINNSNFNCTNVGENMVILTAVDPSENATTCTAIVTVEDKVAPQALCKPVTLYLDANGMANLTVMQIDNGSNDACGIASTSVSPNAFGCNHLGQNTVTLTVMDANNNTSSCNSTVTVVDDMDPTVVCKNISRLLDGSGNVNISPAEVFESGSDNCGIVNLVSVFPNQFDCGEIGVNTATLTVNDGHGNTSTCQATVTIEAFFTNINVSVTPEDCGMANGSISIMVDAPGGQVSYSIDGGANWQFTGQFNNLSAGNYSVVIQAYGGLGCTNAPIPTTVPSVGSPSIWWKDWDGDGYTDGISLSTCIQPAGYVANAIPGDCNDYNANLHPGQIWWKDSDGDGYTDGTSTSSCLQPYGYVLSAQPGDCNDNNASVRPGATEVCNGIDDDCDGDVDEGLSELTYNGNVVFSNQAQVDAWSQCYTVINGNLTIQNSGIDSLGSLINLRKVNGNVMIKQTSLDSLSWLLTLDTIWGSLTVQYNGQLHTLHGLDSLKLVGGVLSSHHNFDCAECCAVYDLINTPGGVGGTMSFFLNQAGCNSVAQINSACEPGSNLIGPGTGCDDCGFAADQWPVEMTVLPNPNNGRFNISLQGNISNGDLLLYDVPGRLIWQQKVEAEATSYYYDGGKKTLRPGLYMLVFRQENGEVFTERIVVQ